jgi:hypothetical protein
MTEPTGTTDPPVTGDPAVMVVGPNVPDEATMKAEIDQDRRHERFLVRAALIAVIAVAIVISVRFLWE